MRQSARAAVTDAMLSEARDLTWPAWEAAHRAGVLYARGDVREVDADHQAEALGRRVAGLIWCAQYEDWNLSPYADRLAPTEA